MPYVEATVPKDLEIALRHFDDSVLGLIEGYEAVRILRGISRGNKIAERCYWYALQHGTVRKTSSYLRGSQRLAGSKSLDFIVTEKDFLAISRFQ
jgi:hypothetical protein